MTDSSDHALLAELRRHTSEAYAAADVEGAASLYVNDAVQQPPGRPAVVGRDAIRASYQHLFALGPLTLELVPWDTVASGDEARERGRYHLTSGDRVLLAGKYIVIATREAEHQWRYVWTTVAPD